MSVAHRTTYMRRQYLVMDYSGMLKHFLLFPYSFFTPIFPVGAPLKESDLFFHFISRNLLQTGIKEKPVSVIIHTSMVEETRLTQLQDGLNALKKSIDTQQQDLQAQYHNLDT